MPSLLATLQNVLRDAGLHVDVKSWIAIYSLIWARFISTFALVPFIGGPSVPGQVRVGLSAILAAVLLPHLSSGSGAVPESALFYLALLAKELIVGALIGMLAQMVFYGVQLAGILIDTQRGMNQITYLAPQLPGHVSALGNLKFQASLVLFLALQGHLIFIRALANSFTFVPLLSMPHVRVGLAALSDQVARISANAILVGAELAAPAVLAIFLIDLSFGCIGKVASQIRIHTDANTAKSWLGLALFLFASAFLLGQLPKYFAGMLHSIEQVTKSLG
jgi:flagellar biosynthesis protein FliR